MSDPEGDTSDDTRDVDHRDGLRRAREALGIGRRAVVATGHVASEGRPVMGETILHEERSTVGAQTIERVELSGDLL